MSFIDYVEKRGKSDPVMKEYCPRCGRKTMDRVEHLNALSRVADVYVCGECGTEEALRDFLGVTLDPRNEIFKTWALPRVGYGTDEFASERELERVGAFA